MFMHFQNSVQKYVFLFLKKTLGLDITLNKKLQKNKNLIPQYSLSYIGQARYSGSTLLFVHPVFLLKIVVSNGTNPEKCSIRFFFAYRRSLFQFKHRPQNPIDSASHLSIVQYLLANIRYRRGTENFTMFLVIQT